MKKLSDHCHVPLSAATNRQSANAPGKHAVVRGGKKTNRMIAGLLS
jgi:hypothetical protein